MTARAKISELEDISSNGWPAREIGYIGGWKLRANDGVTRRANSVLPLSDPGRKLDDAIDEAERFYRSRGLEPRFQITEASVPKNLDNRLDERGYITDITVKVQIASIRNLLRIKANHEAELSLAPSSEWLSTYASAGQYDARSLECRKGILERISAKKAFASVKVSGKLVGVAVGVTERGWLGLFAVETLEAYRRLGVATAIAHSLGIWGKENGAARAYLQVETKNTSALALYEELGFTDMYRYWSRTGYGIHKHV